MSASSVDTLRSQFQAALAAATSPADLKALRDQFLSRKQGLVTALVKSIASATPEDKRTLGAASNALKQEIEAALDGVFQVGGRTGTITISGNVLGAPTGALATIFTVAKCTAAAADGYTSTCSSTGPATPLTVVNPDLASPSGTFIITEGNGTYKVTMITTQDGISYGTTSVLIYSFIIL